MNKSIGILLLAIGTLPVWGQTDALFAERDITGTARYTAMAGAMASVGADPSAVIDNPAGLGLYRRMEVSLTMRGLIYQDRQLASLAYPQPKNIKKDKISSFQIPQASIVFSLENNSPNGLRFCNFMISFNRLHSFNRSNTSVGQNQPSLEALMIDQLNRNGLDELAVSASDFNHPESGWLSELGYQTYRINPDYLVQVQPNGDTLSTFRGWQATHGYLPETALTIDETGYIDEFSAHWAGNIDHRWYIGLGLNIRSLYYTKHRIYAEWYDNTSYAGTELHSYLRQSGVGFSGSVGVIYQPLQWLRTGISFTTPVCQRITTHTDATMDVYDEQSVAQWHYTTRQYAGREILTSPLRTCIGTTFLFGTRGLISLQYDYQHWKGVNDIHTLKIGGEVVSVKRLFIQAGYACESQFKSLSAQPVYRMAYNDVRTDADYRRIRAAHYASVGIGYRGKWFIAEIAYQCRYQKYQLSPFAVSDDFASYQPDYFEHEQIGHRIVLTLGWHN